MSEEKFEVYSKLLKMADLVPPMSIRAGVTLGVFEELKKSPGSSDSIARRICLGSAKLRALLNVLESLSVVRCDQKDIYHLTSLGEFLADGDEVISKVFDLDSALGQYDYSVVDLVDVCRDKGSYFTSKFGKDYWQLVESNAKDRSLVASMSSDTAVFDADQLVSDEVWVSVSKVIDLGGGNGNILIALAEEHPHLHGSVFDLPGRVESARELIGKHRLSSRLEVVGGSFFDYVPEGFDCYLLNAILADWSNSQCIALLRKIRHAIGDEGLLLVSEVDPAAGLEDPNVHLKMICSAEGWVRTPQEVYDILVKSGFELLRSSVSRDRFTHLYRPT
ncbi:methyltransferase [Corynebacterium propinquum]|uniref:methyltransferase n=1 Tax=Corynebacterium propinquum TaxID=43769 RepID=UPI003D76072A